VDIFAEDLDPVRRSQLYHCHRFVKAISELAFGSRKNRKEVGTAIINMAEQIYKEKRIDRIEDEDALEKYLQKRFEVKRMRSDGVFPFVPWSMHWDDDDTQKQEAIKQAIKRAVPAIRYLTKELPNCILQKHRNMEQQVLSQKNRQNYPMNLHLDQIS
jgi:hypothetical protein